MIRAAASPGEIRVAALRGDRLVDYAIDRPGAASGVGDLHRGRITARTPSMAGAFVAIGGADGFLPDSEGGTAPEGTVLGMRITRAAQGGKGPRLSARLNESEQARIGSGPVTLIERGPGAVERFAALFPDSPVVVDDTMLLATLRPLLGDRVSLARRAFDDALEAAVEALADPVAALPGGATMSVHATPALTAIDVDLAGATAGRRGKTATHEAANRAILPALAAQIRLRNLAGAILVDLAGLSPKRRTALAPAFEAALAHDPLRPRFLGFSHLGLAEILRPRIHPPLAALLEGPHAAGLAALREAAQEQAARPAVVLTLHASPAVVDALLSDPAALDDFQRRTGRRPSMQVDRGLAPCGWLLKD